MVIQEKTIQNMGINKRKFINTNPQLLQPFKNIILHNLHPNLLITKTQQEFQKMRPHHIHLKHIRMNK